ncbi:MAG: hypothetical protein IKE91_03405 [Clostridia bacterium]|nr:hypothetical protein [Clostridia bacterium]
MTHVYRNLGDSLQLLLEGFHDIEKCVYATPKEKEAIKAGIDAIMTLECYMNRTNTMPYAHTEFSDGIATIREIADCWNAFKVASNAYKEVKRRHASSTD